MNFLSQILFFFGAVGAFNSIILAIYFSLSKPYSKLENRLFGLFLFILSLRVLKSLFYSFSTKEPIWFLQSGPTFFLLIGPLFFSYTLSVIHPKSFWLKQWKAHILFWLVIVFFFMFLLPFKNNVELYKISLLPIINLQWCIFIILSGIVIKLNYKSSLQMKWLSTLVIAVFIIWASYMFIPFNYFVSGSIIFSTLFYLFFLFFLSERKITSVIFEKTKLKKHIPPSDQNKLYIEKLNMMMIREKLFINPDLKLSEVAQKLGISTHELSKIMNANLGKNFTDFINEYRVKEAKELLKTNTLYTIEAIGNQCGFNSKSAFYKAFKKSTNTTPAKFKS